MFLLFNQLARKFERRANLVAGEAVLALDFFKGHPAREAANHLRKGHTGAPNHEFAMADAWIDDYFIIHGMIVSRG
jgi:hypothetical protein